MCPWAIRAGTLESMTGRQRLLIFAAVFVAFGALGVAAVYSGDTSPSTPVRSGSAADGGGERLDDPDAERPLLDVNPVERWFPQAGEGSGCSEVVGVDLIPGFSALLTINGVAIPPEDTNVFVDGESGVLSAGGSQGQVTWGPEPDCPFGEILRPTANTVTACVYRVSEGPENCRPVTRPDTFDF